MKNFCEFLGSSYTPFHAVENAEEILLEHGFSRLCEENPWTLREGGKYFAARGGALIAFRMGKGAMKIVASHTDSPCFKLKDAPNVKSEPFTRLNAEPYGGGIWYSFFDRPLRIAGRVVVREAGALVAKNFVSEETVLLPSLAIHMDRSVNEGFSPNLQTELPLYSAKGKEFLPDAVSYELYLVPDCAPFLSGAENELLSSPRLDDLTGVYASLLALLEGEGTCVCALLSSEEIGSRTRQGAGGNFLSSVLRRITLAQGLSEEEHGMALASSLLISLDNAHSVHPSHPEKCDPTNRAVMGGGVVIKSHAGGAYTTEALTSAAMRELFTRENVQWQSFYNRSDMRSGGTLGAISLSQACIPSVDLGIAQLAMHSAVETIARADLDELIKGLSAFYRCPLRVLSDRILLG